MAAGDLTTIEDVAGYLGIGLKMAGSPAAPDPTDATVKLLTRLVTSASSFISTHLGRDFSQVSDYVESRNGTGGASMVFADYPVTSVGTVQIDGRVIPACTSNSSPGYLFSDTCLYLRGYRFSRGVQNVLMQYTAGYATIPPEIAQVTIDLVCRKYKERERIGVTSKSINGENVSFAKTDLTDEFKSLLRQYQKVIPV